MPKPKADEHIRTTTFSQALVPVGAHRAVPQPQSSDQIETHCTSEYPFDIRALRVSYNYHINITIKDMIYNRDVYVHVRIHNI